jgi:hypothetical protein
LVFHFLFVILTFSSSFSLMSWLAQLWI